MSKGCPSDAHLSAYLAGDLPGARGVHVAKHLEGCDDCRQLIVAAVQSANAVRAQGSAPTRVDDPMTGDEVGIGTILGRYQLLELIGSGGMGHVYRARDLELDRDVALKVLRPELTASAEMLTARLLRESRLMARLSHPAVVTVYDVGRDGDLVYVAMELIEGTTLASWLRGKRRVDDVLAAFVAAGRGLIAAHRAGLVHRDFKPDNVLVSLDEDERLTRVVVTDLGVARALTSPASSESALDHTEMATSNLRPLSGADVSAGGARSSSRVAVARATPVSLGGAAGPSGSSRAAGHLNELLTVPGATVGTPAYMAPEQIEGRPVDQRADVFAFAASVWEALWGIRPYPGRTLSEIAKAMGHSPARKEPRGRIPRRVTKALLRALQIDAAARTPALELLLAEIDPAAARRRTLTVAASAAAAVLVSGTTAALVLPQPGATPSCEAELASTAALVSDARVRELRAALGATADAEQVIAALRELAGQWQTARRATCPRPLEGLAAACFAARRAELGGIIEDLIAEPTLTPVAPQYLDNAGDPTLCARATAGLAVSSLPEDPAQRQAVRRLRARIISASLLRGQGDPEEALTRLRDIRVAAEARWPAVYAEALYAEGGAEGKIGDSARAAETLKKAAAVAEKAHHDKVAAAAWTQLISSASFADNDVERALEYATYADAALDRLGRPPVAEMIWLYYYGAALAQAERTDEAEAKMQAALQLAEVHDPAKVPLVVQGLGFLYDAKGQYGKAVAMYRSAIASSKEPPASIAVFHAQLAMNLAKHGDRELALVHANRAVADATDEVDPRNDEWQSIKGARIMVLRHLGRFDEALADIPAAQARAAAARGRRSDDVAFYEQLEAILLSDVGKVGEAAALIGRACETLAVALGEDSIDHAGCLADQAGIELAAGKLDAALAHADQSIRVVERLRSFHADVAAIYQVRGEIARRRGDRARAAADFDRAISMCPPYADKGYLASARLAKARLLAETDKASALGLLRQAIEAWQPDPGMWRRQLAEAQALTTKLGG